MSVPIASGPMSHPSLASAPVIAPTPPPPSQERPLSVPAASAKGSMPPPPMKLIIPGIAIGALALAAIVVFLIMRAVKTEESVGASASAPATTRTSAPSAVHEAPAEPSSAATHAAHHETEPVKLSGDVATAMARAQAEFDKGNFATAVDFLAGFSDASKSPELHKLLQMAYSGAKQQKEAMREALRWITADEEAITDLRLDTDVRNAAIGKDAADEAFMLLESHMLTTGVDILWDIAYGESGRNYPQAAYRAQRVLAKADVRAHATKALLLALRSPRFPESRATKSTRSWCARKTRATTARCRR